ncbi:MAG: hypothetical protein MK085_10080, partial [Phycisphaerales bacterium]|nr:hypothetical protein [Phycisphaerales bacterium]
SGLGWQWPARRLVQVLCLGFVLVSQARASDDFVNFESPHVHPIDITPDGGRVLAVNTADNRLEVFDVTGSGLVPAFSVPVGLEPVSVRAYDDDEAWVTNHLSDSVSVVDLVQGQVIATLLTGDEPADVIFAGSPPRAFVSISQRNRIEVFDPADLAAPSVHVPVQGEEPRAMVTDGQRVYAAIFEAGNSTTLIPHETVTSNLNPYPGNPNPPPNDGSVFNPPMTPGLPSSPRHGMILRKDDKGRWMDDNNHDWSASVDWDLHGHGMAVLDVNSLAVSYRTGLLTSNMATAIRADGVVGVVGIEALNEIRFEPVLNGVFLRVEGALLGQGESEPGVRRDLNPHLDYVQRNIPWNDRVQSLGDPRGAAFSPLDNRFWVAGMGSNNLGIFDSALSRQGDVAVGEGPTGLVFDASGQRLYVLNRFEGTVSVVNAVNQLELTRVAFFDPTPQFIHDGRPLLYDTHLTSGLGHVSCGSCHIDGRFDQLAWDLGDPSGVMQDNTMVCNLGVPLGDTCADFHPMKGPMVTQTLVGISGTEPLHWRGDRADLAAFSHAFTGLLAGDANGTSEEMAQLDAFLASINFPPNPNRNLDGTMPAEFKGGDPNHGRDEFLGGNLATINCAACHAEPTGMLPTSISADLLSAEEPMKVPQLRNMYQKVGMDMSTNMGNKGFGFVHDGKFDSLFNFLDFEMFNFPSGSNGVQLRRDVAAFLECWDTPTHAATGAQVQFGGVSASGKPDVARRAILIQVADEGRGELVARAHIDGRSRGFLSRDDGDFQSDRVGEVVTLSELDQLAGSGIPVIYTLVPPGSGTRIALDRDGDGYYDTDEVLACADPADPASVPGEGGTCGMDLDGDGIIGSSDLGLLLAMWGPCLPGEPCPADFDRNDMVDAADLGMLLAAWNS